MGGAQATPSGVRLNYVAAMGPMAQSIELFVDVQQDTVLDPLICPGGAVVAGIADASRSVPVLRSPSAKRETSGLASVDLQILFGNWAFSAFGQMLPFNANFNYLVFKYHRPEWRRTGRGSPADVPS